MANPHVPAVHMNTRFLATTKRWFGGGADLNPPIPYQEDTDAFHARLRAACAPFGPDVYERYAKWAEDYFYIPHRGVHRGVGGIFYDHLECGDDAEYDRKFPADAGGRRGVPRHLPADRAPPHGPALHRGRARRAIDLARALRRIQPRLRPRDFVRSQDRRQYRRDPDEPAAARQMGLTQKGAPVRSEEHTSELQSLMRS